MQINEDKTPKTLRDNTQFMRKLTWVLLVLCTPVGIAFLFIYFKDYSKSKKIKISAAFAVWYIVVIACTPQSASNNSRDKQIAQNTTTEAYTEETTPEESTTELITEETTVVETTQETTTPAPTTTETTTAAPVETTQAETAPPQTERQVWVSGSGKKYHSDPYCSNMSSPYQISLSDAQAQGYEPCKKCY